MIFNTEFKALMGYDAYAWQERLFDLLACGTVIDNLSLPTGSGKTCVIPLWLLARKVNPLLPRRLIYVVDRRSVVDQSTRIVEQIAAKLGKDEIGISTLRGEFEDNQEWSMLPHRPSVVVGTVDMVGSRLLFSGYGDGPYSRSLHAGLLANDAWIVFDECHLVPAFSTLLKNVRDAGGKLRNFYVTTMSATSEVNSDDITLTDEDLKNPTFAKRFTARKTLQIVKSQNVEKSIVSLARTSPAPRTMIFVESPSTVTKIAEELPGKVVCLTGTMRGKERDELVSNPVFQAFTVADEPAEPHYLVATSAGEVGIDLTCSKLISDLAPAQSLAQRFGRCNRFGECDKAVVYVVHSESKKEDRFASDLEFVKSLGKDASCQALWDRREDLSKLSHAPAMITQLEPRVLDILSMTSLQHDIEISEYLRGKEHEHKYVEIAFRTEAELLAQMRDADIDAYLKHFPLLSFERLSEKETRVKELLANAKQDARCLLINAQGEYEGLTLAELQDRKKKLTNGTLILPDACGLGLQSGMLCNSDSEALDVSTLTHNNHEARTRLILGNEDEYKAQTGEKVVFDCKVGDKRIVIVKQKQTAKRGTELLSVHQEEVAKYALEFAEKCGVDELVSAITEAARLHDSGKANPLWQLAARGGSINNPVAKTSYVSSQKLNGYRHEFEVNEEGLVQHLVAAHHAGARPTWTGERPLSPINRDEDKVYEQITRFAELQQKYGAWGLAYIEAILRSADAYASGDL